LHCKLLRLRVPVGLFPTRVIRNQPVFGSLGIQGRHATGKQNPSFAYGECVPKVAISSRDLYVK
jgi:hypothetical protein